MVHDKENNFTTKLESDLNGIIEIFKNLDCDSVHDLFDNFNFDKKLVEGAKNEVKSVLNNENP